MLLRFTVKNFLSFYEETVFDMFPNLKIKSNFNNHVYTDEKIPLLKFAALYGGNGSGKSNFIHAIDLLRNIAINKSHLINFPIDKNRFLLVKDPDENVSFSIEFFIDSKYYIYNIEFNNVMILKEELFESFVGLKSNKVIFRRIRSVLPSFTSSDNQVKSIVKNLLKDNPKSSFLSLLKEFPIINDSRIKKVQKWFKSNLRVLQIKRVDPSIISLLKKDEEFLNFTNNLFKNIGLGINEVKIEQIKLSDYIASGEKEALDLFEYIDKVKPSNNVSKLYDDKVLLSVEDVENENAMISKFLFNHIGVNGFNRDLDYESQSNGTSHLINLLPALYNISKNNYVYVIDEIENSIHPSLIVKLFKYISNKTTKGQLIFSTHETELLNQKEILRPDEIWLTEKVNGVTHIYSLNEFKIHNTINIRNGYLEGRYGAIPFFGELE